MKHFLLFIMFYCVLVPGTAVGSGPDQKCAAVARALSFSGMNPDMLAAHRQDLAGRTPQPVVEALCASSRALTFSAYRQHIERARQSYLQAVGPGFDPAELYFFLQCGEEQVGLSPLAYHAFNLNRDEYGFIGESTLALVWMSTGYLDIRDPERGRSFIDTVNRLLALARQNGAAKEIEIQEDLLSEIEGYREDFDVSVRECGLAQDSG